MKVTHSRAGARPAPGAVAPATAFADCLAADRPKLRALSREMKQNGPRAAKARADFDALLERSKGIVAARRKRLPQPTFDEALPVNVRRDEIAKLIRDHQVVIVCGETGSGKTTQLPKICIEQGRGVFGLIGHTQPRRLAARSVASRLAQELNTQVGMGVGVKIRFHDRSVPESVVKLMTDGILLAETQGDPYLNAYDTIIIDEAHERSLNIDFLLGYLKQILAKRPDLKVIVTSATIDAERFAAHFATDGKPAPVIEVSGRLYPVEVRYRPIQSADAAPTPGGAPRSDREKAQQARDEERDLYDAIVDGVDELCRVGPGDVLVFLPGEREIRDAAEALRKHHFAGPQPEILPLFSRLSAQEQDRVFKTGGPRRVVLATNVAETSLTVPGIRYVVDTGLARVKRYSYRNKIEQLQVEKIAQASANQRSGRCGRVAAGVCIRLYDEADFKARPAFPDPEILRSSLAGVILRMKGLKLSDVEEFPFLSPPPAKAINDGYALLQELGALDDDKRLTGIGHGLAKLPLDPRIARMIVAGRDNGCLRELLVIAAALSVQDPRDRPQDKLQAADERHRRIMFKVGDDKQESSEFLAWLSLWQWYQEQAKHLSHRKLAQACQDHFLSPLRMREWREVHSQLHALVGEAGWKENDIPGAYAAIHKALLSGLLGNIGCKAEDAEKGGHYLGARGIKFLIHPGSALQKKAGRWIMAAELTETTKLYARCVAKIEPEWLEEVGAHLIRRSQFEPHWEKKPMQVVAFERATLYGVVVNPRKRIHYGPLDPKAAREIFIRDGLVAGEIDEAYVRRWPFYQHNRKLIAEIETLEHKQRRQDVLVDDDLIFAFYDHLIPEGIYNGAGFDAWRKEAEATDPKVLFLKKDDLMRHEAAGVTTDAFPPSVKIGGIEYKLAYHFEPGNPRDGVTLTLPLAQLNAISATRGEWLVPGLLKDKVVQLVKTLPQKIRAKLVPVPDFADEFVAACGADEKKLNFGLLPALIDFIHATRGLNARGWVVTPDAFRPDTLPPHLAMNYKLVDEHGRQLAMSRSLTELRAEWGREAKQEFSNLHEAPSEYTGLTDWTFGELPELLEVRAGGQTVVGYPGLKDEGETVSLAVFDSPEEAAAVHRQGLRRLFQLQFKEQVKYFEKNIPGLTQMAMQYMALGSLEELRDQIVAVTFERACLPAGDPLPASEAEFRARCAEAKSRLGLLLQEVARLAGQVLTEWQTLTKKLPGFKAFPAVVADIEAQVKRLMGKRFVADTPFERLQHFPRYLKAAQLRLDKLKADPARDARNLADYAPLWTNYERRALQLAKQGVADPQLVQFRWLLEELRVNLFAQELRTPVPVSVKRLQKQWEGIQYG
ncbi:ATP-dependent RNA helicase HrpA [Oryzomicrobium sp.]|uniref:ATP-dependent RNA helicase HrpA n=1 Tax=Oryzomicrobium sp. TaxID=1911578 RepID=UPI0025E3075F|nr:ATP-dependent RNA helicase HrpA [Oryzomicrobium sp.]MCE1241644.1 ATP-dependent RNA helicase HrpA [Oryzomicrobium sp.]